MNPIQQRLYNDQLAWAKDVVALAKNNLLKRNKIATGVLYNSISFEINTKGEVTFLADETAEFVESGRKPNSKFPPPPAIEQWAKIKGIPQFRDKRGRYISNESRTFLLSRAIAKNGIRPFPFYTDAVEESIAQLEASQEQALIDGIEIDLEI